MVDIEDTIRATMGGAHYAPPPPRDLKPFLISANEILRADIPQKKFLVSSFIPSASFGMVFAPRGIGKSWFAFGLGKAIATGTDTFLGWQIHEQGDVLFVDGEMSMVDLKERTSYFLDQRVHQDFTYYHQKNFIRTAVQFVSICPMSTELF